MTRHFKTLGLALVAVFALTAIGASPASAAAVDVLTGPKETFPVTAVSENSVFQLSPGGASIGCSTAHFTGTAQNGASELVVAPKYSGTFGEPKSEHCSFVTGTIKINMKSCAFALTGETADEGTPETPAHAQDWVVCNPGDQITVSSSTGITVSVPAQTPTGGGITYTNSSGKVIVDEEAAGVTYTCAPAFACGLAGIPTHSNGGRYTATVVAESSSGAIEFETQ